MADVTITPSNVVPPAANTTTHYAPVTLLAGAAINAGEVVCLYNSAIHLADSDDADKLDVIGIAGNTAEVAGQRVDVITASPALAVGTHGVALGTPLYLSDTPGKLCPYADLASGDYPILVAFAATNTTLKVAIAASSVAIP